MLRSMWNIDTPFSGDLERLRREVDNLFNFKDAGSIRGVPSGSFPMLNIGENENSVTVLAFVPGVAADGLDVSVQSNVLTIRGKRETDGAAAGDQTQPTFFRRERFDGEFSRVVSLPDSVDPDSINAEYKNGVLSVTVSKKAETQPRRITVQSAS